MAKKKPAATGSDTADKLDFEQAIEEVEQIVTQLEGGQLGLTESLQQYELGVKRLKQCHGLLDAAEQRVLLLSGLDADGNPVTAPLDGPTPGERASGERASGGKAPDRKAPDRDDRVGDSPGLF